MVRPSTTETLRPWLTVKFWSVTRAAGVNFSSLYQFPNICAGPSIEFSGAWQFQDIPRNTAQGPRGPIAWRGKRFQPSIFVSISKPRFSEARREGHTEGNDAIREAVTRRGIQLATQSAQPAGKRRSNPPRRVPGTCCALVKMDGWPLSPLRLR